MTKGSTGFERPLTKDEARWAVEQAAKAPSIHNTQPWRFRWEGDTFELYADTTRVLSAVDPDGRELVISCGAALLGLRLALRKVGFDSKVRVLPDPANPRLLAGVVATEGDPASQKERLAFAGLLHRHTHRGGFEDRSIESTLLVELQHAAEVEGAELVYVHDFGQRRRVLGLARAAANTMAKDADVSAEVLDWTPPAGSRRRDGVPAAAYEAEPRSHDDDLPARDFDLGRGQGSLRSTAPVPAGVIALLATVGDRQVDWLAAGQALERVLVTATVHGISAAVHSQLAELASSRNELRREFYSNGCPQLLLRFGYAPPGKAPTPRRPVDDIVDLT
jgi:nitroreductase